MINFLHKKNITISRSLIFILLLYSLVLVISFTSLFPKNDITTISQYWSFLVFSFFVHFMYLFLKKFKSFNYPFLFFVIGIIICWFGQVFIASFGYLNNPTLTVFEFSPIIYYHTVQYSVIAFYIFCLTGLIFTKKNNYTNVGSKIEDKYLRRSANYASAGLLLVSGPLFVKETLSNLNVSLTRGYSEIYQTDISSQSYGYGIINTISQLFIPALFIFFIANKNSFKARLFVYLCITYYLFVSFATGSRGYAIALIVSFLWLYFNEIKKYNLKVAAALLPLTILITKLFSVIAEFRSLKVRNTQSFVELALRPEGKNEFILGSLREFGFNIFSLYNTMLIVPAKQSFANGYTYLATVAVILPKFFYAGYSFTNDTALARWLMNKLGLRYGPGFTFVAEAYYNFGWLGMIAVALIAFIITRLLSNNETTESHKSIRNAFVAVVVYYNLFIARDTSLFILRKYIYFVLIPAILIAIIYKNIKPSVSYE